jgi:hypothetical protein
MSSTTDRVDHVRSGESQTDRRIQAFAEYRYNESNGQLGVVRFVYQSANSKSSVYFLAVLNGLMTPGGPVPSDFGATEIERLWKLKCHVCAYTLFG